MSSLSPFSFGITTGGNSPGRTHCQDPCHNPRRVTAFLQFLRKNRCFSYLMALQYPRGRAHENVRGLRRSDDSATYLGKAGGSLCQFTPAVKEVNWCG